MRGKGEVKGQRDVLERGGLNKLEKHWKEQEHSLSEDNHRYKNKVKWGGALRNSPVDR